MKDSIFRFLRNEFGGVIHEFQLKWKDLLPFDYAFPFFGGAGGVPFTSLDEVCTSSFLAGQNLISMFPFVTRLHFLSWSLIRICWLKQNQISSLWHWIRLLILNTPHIAASLITGSRSRTFVSTNGEQTPLPPPSLILIRLPPCAEYWCSEICPALSFNLLLTVFASGAFPWLAAACGCLGFSLFLPLFRPRLSCRQPTLIEGWLSDNL